MSSVAITRFILILQLLLLLSLLLSPFSSFTMEKLHKDGFSSAFQFSLKSGHKYDAILSHKSSRNHFLCCLRYSNAVWIKYCHYEYPIFIQEVSIINMVHIVKNLTESCRILQNLAESVTAWSICKSYASSHQFVIKCNFCLPCQFFLSSWGWKRSHFSLFFQYPALINHTSASV